MSMGNAQSLPRLVLPVLVELDWYYLQVLVDVVDTCQTGTTCTG